MNITNFLKKLEKGLNLYTLSDYCKFFSTYCCERSALLLKSKKESFDETHKNTKDCLANMKMFIFKLKVDHKINSSETVFDKKKITALVLQTQKKIQK